MNAIRLAACREFVWSDVCGYQTGWGCIKGAQLLGFWNNRGGLDMLGVVRGEKNPALVFSL